MHKRILSFFSLLAMVLILGSCGAQKKNSVGGTEASGGPSASQWRAGVKGTWVLNSVDRENIPTSYTIKNIFDEAPVECFIGSVWNLPGGAHRGSITFNADGTLCANGAVRNIVWSIYNPGTSGGEPAFQFKKIYAGDKASNVNSGYRLDLSYANENELTMRMPIPLDEGQGFLVFHFARQN